MLAFNVLRTVQYQSSFSRAKQLVLCIVSKKTVFKLTSSSSPKYHKTHKNWNRYVKDYLKYKPQPKADAS